MGGLAGLAAIALENALLLDELRWNANHDPLTGLANRTLLEHKLVECLEWANPRGRLVAVIYGDLDRFKRTNDSLGHSAGDDVLLVVTARLTALLRAEDVVARPSGDEFVVILPDVSNIAEAYAVADRIEKSIAEPLVIQDREVFVSISLGVALSQGPVAAGETVAESAERLISFADAAMYRAKARKRPGLGRVLAAGELRLDSDLHRAIERGEISVEYQPQVDLASGKIVAVEALARWEHGELGSIPPDIFIPIAEENGLIDRIGGLVLSEACAFGAQWLDREGPLEVSVNVSAQQLAQPDFFHRVEVELTAHQLPAHLLTLEITESVVVPNLPTIEPQLRALRELGIGVSVDDFGTGYSSLSQLHDLPVNELKIDQSFVQKDGVTGGALIAAVMEIAKGLELRVVAEGVETEEQRALVRGLGCDRAQGFLLGRPMAAAALSPLL